MEVRERIREYWFGRLLIPMVAGVMFFLQEKKVVKLGDFLQVFKCFQLERALRVEDGGSLKKKEISNREMISLNYNEKKKKKKRKSARDSKTASAG